VLLFIGRRIKWNKKLTKPIKIFNHYFNRYNSNSPPFSLYHLKLKRGEGEGGSCPLIPPKSPLGTSVVMFFAPYRS